MVNQESWKKYWGMYSYWEYYKFGKLFRGLVEIMKFDYLVVGSGLYGAVFAQQVKAAGKSVLVIDKRTNIAGNVYTEKVEGINFHK